MKVYTKTGDDGKTSLLSGKRVLKNSSAIEAYGEMDELIVRIGHLRALEETQNEESLLIEVQDRLFRMASILSNEGNPIDGFKSIDDEDILKLENQMDQWDLNLPRLKNFVLVGGLEESSRIHLCRTSTRKTERLLVSIEDFKVDPIFVRYLNRLSDWFFVYARVIEHRLNFKETIWKS